MSEPIDQVQVPQPTLGKLWLKLLVFILSALIVFGCAWFWLTLQLKDILSSKIDETGQQLSQIAAIAAAEPVLSEDVTYLEKLTEALLKEPFIEKVAIYRPNGTELISRPIQSVDSTDGLLNGSTEPKESTAEATWRDWLTAHLPKYQSRSIVFMPEISWDQQSVGWIQLTIDRKFLEQGIRDNSYQITLSCLLAFGITLVIGLAFILRSHWKQFKAKKVLTPNNRDDESETHLHAIALQAKKKTLSSQTRFRELKVAGHSSTQPVVQEYSGVYAILKFELKPQDPFDSIELSNAWLHWLTIFDELKNLHQIKIETLESNTFLITPRGNDVKRLISFGYCVNRLAPFFSYYNNAKLLVEQGSLIKGIQGVSVTMLDTNTLKRLNHLFSQEAESIILTDNVLHELNLKPTSETESTLFEQLLEMSERELIERQVATLKQRLQTQE